MERIGYFWVILIIYTDASIYLVIITNKWIFIIIIIIITMYVLWKHCNSLYDISIVTVKIEQKSQCSISEKWFLYLRLVICLKDYRNKMFHFLGILLDWLNYVRSLILIHICNYMQVSRWNNIEETHTLSFLEYLFISLIIIKEEKIEDTKW